MKTLLKTTLKLLFRNVGFGFFLLITPALSALIMSVKVADNTYYIADTQNSAVTEIETIESKVAYYNTGGGMLVVKVYDASGSELSDYFLKKLSSNGMFKLCRAKADGMDRNALDERLKIDGFEDRMGAVIFLAPSFDKDMMDGRTDKAFEIFRISDDGRCAVLEEEARLSAGKIAQSSQGKTVAETLEILRAKDGLAPEKKIVTVYGSGERALNKDQSAQKTVMGYAFAFLTLGFVFCGVFVAHTVIQEQKEQVLTRIKLTTTSTVTYFISKIVCGVIVSGMLTLVLGVFTLFISEDKIGMSKIELLLLTFLLGMIFCSISLLLGILLDDVMSSNVAAFTIWSLSSLLAGLYFPLNATTNLIKVISSIMPQKWFLDGTEMILVGDNMAYFMVLCVTVAYLTVIVSLGSLGIKFKKAEA